MRNLSETVKVKLKDIETGIVILNARLSKTQLQMLLEFKHRVCLNTDIMLNLASLRFNSVGYVNLDHLRIAFNLSEETYTKEMVDEVYNRLFNIFGTPLCWRYGEHSFIIWLKLEDAPNAATNLSITTENVLVNKTLLIAIEEELAMLRDGRIAISGMISDKSEDILDKVREVIKGLK